MPHAAIYVRLSKDREDQTSTARQEADCRAWAAAHGYEVVAVHEDVGLSGYADVVRPGFVAALEALTAGTVEALVVWKLDRLSRRGVGQVGLILDQLERTGGRIVSVMDGVDTAHAQGRIIVALLAELARAESANTSTRVRSAKRLQLAQGRWLGGRIPWGYRIEAGRLWQTPDAAWLRQMAERATRGESVRSIAAWLTAEGVPAPRGGRWGTSSVAQMLRNPVLAGLQPRGRNGRDGVHTDDSGQSVVVTDEPILSHGERRALMMALDGRTGSAGGRRAGRRPARSLLGGLLRCGLCTGPMTSAGAYYRCQAATQRRGACPGVSCPQAEADEYVVRSTLSYLAALDPEDEVRQAVEVLWAGPAAAQPVAELAELAAAVADVEARMADLEDARYLRGEFPGAAGSERYSRIRERLAEEAVGLRGRLADLALPEPAGLPDDAGLLREAWDEAPAGLRRQVLDVAVAAAVAKRAGRRGLTWNGMERISVTFS